MSSPFFLKKTTSRNDLNEVQAEGDALFFNFSESADSITNNVDAKDIVKGKGALGIAEFDSTALKDPTFTQLLNNAEGFGEETFEGEVAIDTEVVANFEVAANQTFSFNFSANSFLSATEIENPDAQYNKADINVGFLVLDISGKIPKILDVFSMGGKLISSKQIAKQKIRGSRNVKFDVKDQITDIDGDNGVDFVDAFASGYYERMFEEDTKIAIVKFNQTSIEFAGDNLIGNLGDDVTYGTLKNDSFRGSKEDDKFYTSLGDDKVYAGRGDDIIEGSLGDDTLHGGKGDDSIYGGLDNDLLIGAKGDDVLVGGDGNDVTKGGRGNDTMTGGAGDDTLDGGKGDDSISGGLDNDLLIGAKGDDVLVGDDGNDVIKGGRGNDIIEGGTGDDTLHGGKGDDIIEGGAGDDTLDGGKGDDSIYGGLDNDLLIGAKGDDVLVGGDGNDVIKAGLGSDTMTGGAGNDTFVFNKSWLKGELNVITDFESGIDTIQFKGLDSFSQISDTNDGVLLTFDFGRKDGQLLLEGVEANDLSTSDFIFG
ncbi:MAG: calcium-binding protein [Calothrix sp. MO_192.B10]|nr:calcium-binding protein [Calothrix sp. MO_192.B10]